MTISEPELICLGCKKEVKQKSLCPVCAKYAIESVFCSQDCFKQTWSKHKGLHDALADAVSSNNKDTCGIQTLKNGFDVNRIETWLKDINLRCFKNYKFTGSLRPWPRTAQRLVPDHIKKPDYYLTGVPAGEIAVKNSKRIIIHNEDQIKRIKRCSILARRALDLGHSLIKPGATPDEIDAKIFDFIVENNAYPSPLNYRNFPKSCCISVNEVICHGIPDLRPLQNGDIVNIDITVYSENVHGDLNETYICGEADESARNLIKGAYESMMYAIAECRPGMPYYEIGDIISKTVEARGLSVVRSYCGHGIGELFHTIPNVPHYGNNRAQGNMKVGHIFTIEPMINEGTYKDDLWPDDWTAVTRDGKRSAQFEHTLLITPTGVEILTARLPTSPPLEIDIFDESYYLNKMHKKTKEIS